MITYISILRGINVSGKNLIKMNSLQEIYTDLGFSNVKTFIQSGNVVFKSKETSIEKIEKVITEEILKRNSFNVPVIVIEKSELRSVLEQNPFLKERTEDIKKLYVTFMAKDPDKNLFEEISKRSYLPDEYNIIGRAVYLFCPNGYGNTKLSNNFFERKLKVNATTRNLNTLMELLKIGDSI